MTDVTSVNLAVGGVLMPFIIAAITQSHWSPKLKGLVAFVACLVAAAILAWLHGGLDVANWRNTAIVVTGAALAMYHLLWRPSTIAPAIEAATTVTGPRAPTTGG